MSEDNAPIRSTIDRHVIGGTVTSVNVVGRDVTITMEDGTQLEFHAVSDFLVKTGRWRFEPNAPKVKRG